MFFFIMVISVLQFIFKVVMIRHHFLLKCIQFYQSFCKQHHEETTKACKICTKFKNRSKKIKYWFKKKKLSTLVDIVITLKWERLHRKCLRRCIFKSLGKLHLSPAPCFLVSWSELATPQVWRLPIEPPRSLGNLCPLSLAYCLLLFWSGTACSGLDCSHIASAALSLLMVF